MKAMEMAEATESLADYARRARREPVVVLDHGRTVAAVVPLDGEDWEDFVVTHHPGLISAVRESMEAYRAEGGASLEEVMKECGLPTKAAVRRPARPTRRSSRK